MGKMANTARGRTSAPTSGAATARRGTRGRPGSQAKRARSGGDLTGDKDLNGQRVDPQTAANKVDTD